MVIASSKFQDVVSVVLDGGSSWEGWTQAEVRREIDHAAGSFAVDLTNPVDTFPVEQINPFSVAAVPECKCKVLVNGKLVLTGQIDECTDQIDGNNHTVQITGRSLGRNAIDSSHIDGGNRARLNDVKPSDICKRVTNNLDIPFKFGALAERDIEWHGVNQGESALNVMRSAALKQGLTIGHDADGSITLKDKFEERAPASLVMGENILKSTVRRSSSGRNSEYIGRGQKLPNAETRGKSCNQVRAEAKDEGLKTTKRPKYIIGLGDVDAAELKERVSHEAARRAGQSLNVTVTVVGWTVQGSGLWEPGQLAYVQIPQKNVGEVLLIKTVRHVKDFDPTGTITEMTLVAPEAYQKGSASGARGQPGTKALKTDITAKAA